MLTQAAIENSLLTEHPVQGFVTDIKRAFNNLPRMPILMMAKHLGFPESLVHTWMNFLKEADRYFVVRQVVSSPLQSTCGLPEGCAVSCIGMLLVNHCHALYMQQYAPQILSLSFVDNYELLTRQVAHLAHGILPIWPMASWYRIPSWSSYVWRPIPARPTPGQHVRRIGKAFAAFRIEWLTRNGTLEAQ